MMAVNHIYHQVWSPSHNNMFLEKLFFISSNHPDDLRRGRLLIILMAGTAVLTIISMVAVFLFLQEGPAQADQRLLYMGGLILIIVIGFSWWLARTRSVTLSAVIFTSIFALIVLLDTPSEVVHGRSLSLTVIPILLASLTIRPWAGFSVAIINGILINVIAYSSNIELNIVGAGAFMLVALISGLGASSFESILTELRETNTVLDIRVLERTADYKEARDQAIQANIVKTEMLAKVSHELRTPLGAILGFTEMLRAGVYGENTSKKLETYEKILHSHDRLSAMINDLLNQSHMEFGRMKIDPRRCDINEVVHNIESSLRIQIEAKGLNLVCEISDDMPRYIVSDIQRLEQVIINLLTNALKFTEEGTISLAFNSYSETLFEIIVADTGIGISADDMELIFEAFRQVDGEADRKTEGFGLGLSIVKQIVSLMGGNIQVKSKLGEGSSFTIILPTNIEVSGASSYE